MKELARALLTVLVVAQGAVMLAVELNRTHATHPRWPGHARFHLVWQNLSAALFAVLEAGLLWWPGGLRVERFYLVAGLAGVPLSGFVLAMLARSLYGGTMWDDEAGLPPLHLLGRLVDGNTAAVALGWIALTAAMAMFRW